VIAATFNQQTAIVGGQPVGKFIKYGFGFQFVTCVPRAYDYLWKIEQEKSSVFLSFAAVRKSLVCGVQLLLCTYCFLFVL
jgi:hypothetical protein